MRTATWVLLSVATLSAACRPTEQRTDSMNADRVRQARERWSPAMLAQLDSGGVAYREGRYSEANRHYHAAAELAPDAAAAWFGVYMAEDALGNVDQATVALERARELAPGATLLFDTAGGAP